MILTPLWRVEPDALLARSVVARGGGHPQTLLESGRRLSPTLLGALARAGVDWVYLESDLAEGIAPGPLLPSSSEDSCRESLDAVFDIGRRHNGRVSARHVDELCQMAAELLIVARTRGATPLSHDLTRPDDDPIGHALVVATIGLAIGEIIVPTTEVPADAVAWHLTHLGAGLLLHDIGTVATPPDVLSTRGPLNEMQREMVRWHTQAGEQMISGTVPPHVALVATQHHEWFGGGGYPEGVAGDGIHINARIAAVADAYDALATRSLTTAGRPSDAGLRMVRLWTGTAFDPAVVDALEQVIAPFAPGCPVILSDKSRGVVVENTPGRPQHPTVRVTHGPDGEPLTPHDRALAAADEIVTVIRVIDHPSEPRTTKRPSSADLPRAPSLAIRGIEAGGLLDTPSRAGSTAAQ
jgi:HD-GYP domain-containing protein (c-di-GMP phosphodiesterase class II)